MEVFGYLEQMSILNSRFMEFFYFNDKSLRRVLEYQLKRVCTVGLNLFANLAPSLLMYNANQELHSAKDAYKMRKIQQMCVEIQKDLGVSNMRVNVTKTKLVRNNAFCLGNRFSFTGPCVAIGQAFFDRYLSTEFNRDSSYQVYRDFLQSSPNDPLDLAFKLDTMSKGQRQKIYALSQKFASTFSDSTLMGVLAHELGHAKNNHLIRGFVARTLTMRLLEFIFLSPFESPHRNYFQLNPLWKIPAVFFGLFATAYFSLQFSVQHEWEADKECQSHPKYAWGIHQFFKQSLLQEIANRNLSHYPTCTSFVQHQLKQSDTMTTHPATSKRMRHAHEMALNPTFQPRSLSMLAKVVSTLGFGVLIYDCYYTLKHIALLKIRIR